jgi:hypothetical protein
MDRGKRPSCEAKPQFFCNTRRENAPAADRLLAEPAEESYVTSRPVRRVLLISTAVRGPLAFRLGQSTSLKR